MSYIDLENKIRNAQHVDFGYTLDNCINLFKEVWLKGFLLILIIVILSFGLGFLFAFLGLGSSEVYVGENGFSISSFYSENIIYSLPQSIIIATFSIGLIAGFYRICKYDDLNENGRDDFFYFFKGAHVSKILMLGIIQAVIAIVAQLMFFIPYIYAFVPLSFFSVFLAFNPDLSEVEIVKLSFQLGTKKWLVSFGLIVITAILGMLGIFACGIGLLFTISIAYLPVYFIYRDVIGFDNTSEIDLIGSDTIKF